MKKYICTVCGYIHEGDAPPEVCPICKVGADKFEEVQGEMQWADEHRIGVAKDIDKDIIEGLRANFVGECTEVGMYLAMARQADREGYPEVAEAYTRIAYEEAELAKKHNLDAIHDTVHEMCKDEARHGRAFKGLLDRYFTK